MSIEGVLIGVALYAVGVALWLHRTYGPRWWQRYPPPWRR